MEQYKAADPKTTAASVKVVQTIYDAAYRGDVTTVIAMIDENVECHESPSIPYGKVYRGHAGIKELFGPLSQHLDLPNTKIDHIIADGEWVVVVITAPVRSSGVVVTASEHHRVRNGKVVEQHIYFFEPTQVR